MADSIDSESMLGGITEANDGILDLLGQEVGLLYSIASAIRDDYNKLQVIICKDLPPELKTFVRPSVRSSTSLSLSLDWNILTPRGKGSSPVWKYIPHCKKESRKNGIGNYNIKTLLSYANTSEMEHLIESTELSFRPLRQAKAHIEETRRIVMKIDSGDRVQIKNALSKRRLALFPDVID